MCECYNGDWPVQGQTELLTNLSNGSRGTDTLKYNVYVLILSYKCHLHPVFPVLNGMLWCVAQYLKQLAFFNSHCNYIMTVFGARGGERGRAREGER